jgi:ATP-dependent DNA helicase RecG
MSNSAMSSGLPINLDDLIHHRTIESNRVEFKATWNHPIKPAVVKSVCAFANDLLNLNGGYVILGVEDHEGHAVLPPRGLDELDLDKVQKEIRGACCRIAPEYQPVLFPVDYQGKALIVVWTPGGDNRPYQAPHDINQKGSPLHYFIRQGPQTLQAKGAHLTQLMESAAKVPFDDRRNLGARIEDLSPTLVRRFLHDIRSSLIEEGSDFEGYELYRKLRVVKPINGHETPRNVGLLFFHEDPDRFFPGARLEVAQFGADSGGDLIEERTFRGPLNEQVKQTLEYLNSFGGTMLQKISGQAEVDRTVAYPYEAMEEAIVNAVYHRGYEGPPEPVKVHLYPDRMEIISYPGPVPGVTLKQFEPGAQPPVAPARNRRIGDFLKELRLAEPRSTGIPKIQRRMRENGSPQARFDFDEDQRTYFRATLPVHPRFLVLHALREAAHLWAIGERHQALDLLNRAFDQQPSSGALASQLIEYAFGLEDPERARQALDRFDREHRKSEGPRPYLTHARLLIDRNRAKEGIESLNRIPKLRTLDETLEAAILKKRSGDLQGAHRLFAEVYSLNPDDPKIIQEYAQTKIGIASNFTRDHAVKKRLNREAAELLRRAIQLSNDPVRSAWCWYDLARTLEWLRVPSIEVEAAFLRACSLHPNEPIFAKAFERWKKNESARG